MENKKIKITFVDIIVLVVVCVLIWFIFFRDKNHYVGLADYRDTWFTDTRLVLFEYCGNANTTGVYCDPGKWTVADARWDGKEKASGDSKWIHYFTIFFNNGGYVSTEGTCDKAASGYYSYDRFCRLSADDGSVYLIAPRD